MPGVPGGNRSGGGGITVEFTTLEQSKSGMPESSKLLLLVLTLLISDWQNSLNEAFSLLTSESILSSNFARQAAALSSRLRDNDIMTGKSQLGLGLN